MNQPQRQKAYKGGIQAGTSATSLSSRALEVITMTHLKANVIPKLDPEKVSWIKEIITGKDLKARQNSLYQGVLAGMAPDGGIFQAVTPEKTPLLSIECKYQGLKGNAIERWFKNSRIFETLGLKKYVTFCLGEGFQTGTSTSILASAAFNHGLKVFWDDNINPQDNGTWLAFYRFTTLEEARQLIPPIIDFHVSDLIRESPSV